MAGFSKDDAYFVPRATLTFNQRPWESITKLLLPKIEVWRRQVQNRRGDKSSCATTFLNLMLPWFVEVLVQDGAFFIHSFPNHPVANFLKVRRCFGPYTTILVSLLFLTMCSVMHLAGRINYLIMPDGQHEAEQGVFN
jgi:Centromere DNA-binding protein complex CBF3 subunit, domain 2